ncbi:MAG TPA: CHAT domain-containing protein, partial [Bacteroidetes bacterium]|nr:CHAT domain-containing protein [Bacteroidota bacterium]
MFFRIFLVIICLMGTGVSAFAQESVRFDSVESLYQAGQLEMALERGQRYLFDLHQGKVREVSAYVKCEILLGQIFIGLEKLDSAYFYLQAAIEHLKPDDVGQEELLLEAYLYLGNCLGKWGRLDESKAAFMEMLRLADENNPLVGRAYANIGLVFLAKKEYIKAQEYLEKGAELFRQTLGEESMMLGYCYNNLYGLHGSLAEYEKAAEYLRQSIEIKSRLGGPENVQLVHAYINLSGLYAQQGKFRSAIVYMKMADDIRSKVSPVDHPDFAKIYSGLAMYYVELGQGEKSAENIEKTLQVLENNPQKGNPEAGKAYLFLAEIYLKHQNIAEANVCLEKGVKILGYNPQKPKDFEQVLDMGYLDYYFDLEQKKFRQLLLESDAYVDALYRVLNDHLALYKFLLREPIEDSDRQLRTAFAYPLFEAFLLHLYENPVSGQKEAAFALMEMSKSRLLAESFQLSRAEQLAGVPDALLSKEKAQLSLLAETKFMRFSAKQASAPDSLIQALDTEIIEIKQAHQRLVDRFRTDYPAYHQLKYNHDLSSILEIQADLEDDEGLLEYFVGDSNLFLMLITSQAVQFEKVVKDFPLEDWIKAYRAGIFDYWMLAEREDSLFRLHAQIFCGHAHQLYEKLIAPVKAKLPAKVTLIPDGILNFIPFDALLCVQPDDPTNFASHAYLLQDHLFSLHYSGTLWQQLAVKASSAQKGLLAFAPAFQRREGISSNPVHEEFGPLYHNVSEVEKIHQLISGELVLGPKATKARFQEMAHAYRILHLATHAKSNDRVGDYSFIAFADVPGQDNKLYVRDLYALSLNADLVVLSACETGLGELKRGEGIISLSRGFMYAGAASTVTSLWSVNDAETSVLMAHFYAGLKAGKAKDEALRAAKLHYMQSNSAPHPYYWAGFVATGD